MSPAVGIDIGNHKCVIAISRNFVVDAVLNEESSRETPTVVHFAKDHRVFGGSGASNAATKPKSTISQLKRLVGRRSDEAAIADELQLLPFHTSWDADGNILVEVTNRDGKHEFTAVEMLVMLLSHMKRVTMWASGSDCVIGVPAYFTADQKTAYLNSARAAGWNPLGLLADGAAGSILYGAQRREQATEACVVFVDVGHCDTQITVAHIQGQAPERRILAVVWDHKIGGRDFDEIIFKQFADRFRDQHGVDVAGNEKAVARLRIACEKAKKVLSTNRDARINLECFVGDIDLEGEITRTDFQASSSELVDKIGQLFNRALEEANLAVDQVNFVELMGSGSRIPAISEKPSGIFRRALSRTMNGSECIACGCALLCEMLQRMERLHHDNVIELPEEVSRLGLTSNEFTSGFTSSDDISSLLEKEEQLANLDRVYHSGSDERNSLESYIYRKRSELSKKVESCPKEREEISRALQEAEDWVNDDNRDGDAYKKKLSELRMSIRSIDGASLENPTDPPNVQIPHRWAASDPSSLVWEENRNQETAFEHASAGSDLELTAGEMERGNNILGHTANAKSKGASLGDLISGDETIPGNIATSPQPWHRRRKGNFHLPGFIRRQGKKRNHPESARVDPFTIAEEKDNKAENKTETEDLVQYPRIEAVAGQLPQEIPFAADEHREIDPELPINLPRPESYHGEVHNLTEDRTARSRTTLHPKKTFKRRDFWLSIVMCNLFGMKDHNSPTAEADSISISHQLQAEKKTAILAFLKKFQRKITKATRQSDSSGFMVDVSSGYTGHKDPQV